MQMKMRNFTIDASAPLPLAGQRLYRLRFVFGLPAFVSMPGIFWLTIARPEIGF
jgi:uncharacterized membrane protein